MKTKETTYMSNKTIIERSITETEQKIIDKFIGREKAKNQVWKYFISSSCLLFAGMLISLNIHHTGIDSTSNLVQSIICYAVACAFIGLSVFSFKRFPYDEKFILKLAILELEKKRSQEISNLHSFENLSE